MNKKCLVVGIPKSGNNVCKLACEKLGLDVVGYRHTSRWQLATTNNVVYIYRNPRDVLVSCLRYTNDQVRGREKYIDQERLIDTFYDFFNCSLSGVERAYLPWMETNACKVKYEDLVHSQNGIDQIAAYFGVKKGNDIKIYGEKTATWTGKPSDWRSVWGERIEQVWIDEGMHEIEQKMGYLNEWN